MKKFLYDNNASYKIISSIIGNDVWSISPYTSGWTHKREEVVYRMLELFKIPGTYVDIKEHMIEVMNESQNAADMYNFNMKIHDIRRFCHT